VYFGCLAALFQSQTQVLHLSYFLARVWVHLREILALSGKPSPSTYETKKLSIWKVAWQKMAWGYWSLAS